MSVWLDSSSNSNKFKQSYFRDFVDVSGDILIRNGLSLKLYNNSIPTRVQFSVNSNEFRIFNDSDQTYYDISNTKLIYLQNLSENVQDQLDVFTDKTRYIATDVTTTETMIELNHSQQYVTVHAGLDVSSTIVGHSDLSINQNVSIGGNAIVKGRLDICGNLYAQYAANSIPSNAIIGTVNGISTDVSNALYLKADLSYVNSSFTSVNNSIALLAPAASPTFTGIPLAPTASAGTNTTQIATTAFVKTAVDNLIAGAPAALDTLNELATALNNDASFSTTVTNSLASKAPVSNPTFTGTVNGSKLQLSSDASFSGRVDICGNLYANYPSGSIPASAIIGGVSSINLNADISVNGVTVGRGGGNVAVNTALGYRALFAQTADVNSCNTAIGYNTLAATVAGQTNNTAVGFNALAANTGGFNTAVGSAALQANTSGYMNVAIGPSVLQANTTGSYNIAMSWGALIANSSGSDNVALGNQALNANQTGGRNIAIGTLALKSNTTNSYSTAVGWRALLDTTGTSNTAFGYAAGISNTTGAYTTSIGYGADTSGTTWSSSTAIGANAKITASNQVALGTATETVYIPGKVTIITDASFNGRVDICGNFYAQYPASSIPSSAIIGGVGGGASVVDVSSNQTITGTKTFSKIAVTSDASFVGRVDIGNNSLTTQATLAIAQIGSNLSGRASGIQSGYSVALNDTGTIVALGCPNDNSAGGSTGSVRIYQSSNNVWSQLGSDILGTTATTYLGCAVSLNSTGTIVAMGGYGYQGGIVKVYQYVSNAWTQLGQTITGTGTNGYSVSLSSDGLTVAMGSYNDNANGTESGSVSIFKYANSTWTKLGQTIAGEAPGDWSGVSVGLSSDGTIVAIGAMHNNGVTGSQSGQARVYKYANSTWTQLGQDIDGEAAADMSGWSIAINDDGTVIAIGAPRNTTGVTTYNGQVRVYKYANSTWTKLGQDIDGRAIWALSGNAVSLSSDGYTVAIGASYANGLGGETYRGYACVYKYNGTTWTMIGSYIEGQAANDQFGTSISINSDGSIVAIGTPYNTGNNGRVQVYKVQTPSSKLIVSDGLDICGNFYANKIQLISDASFNGRVDICGNFYAQYPPNSIPASAIIGGVGGGSSSSSSGSLTGGNVTFADSFALIKEAVVVDPASLLLRQF